MARFNECIASAQAQGELDADEAAMLRALYDAQVKATGDEMAAKAKMVEQLTAEAERKERLARLSAERADQLATVIETFRNPRGEADAVMAIEGILDNRNNLLVGVPSVTGRRDALVGMAHARLEGLLHATRRKAVSGLRRGGAMLDDMVDEAFGKGTGNEQAAAFLKAWRETADWLVDRFNAAGGEIAKIKDYFPQNHEAGKMLAAGKAKWIEEIGPKLDTAAMRDPLHGGPLTAERLAESLSVIYDRIVTDGAIDMQPSRQAMGRGALANQRQEHRFLVFKDADAWRAYHEAFGGANVYNALMNHINGLAKDVAALEVLGPNPNATVTWLGQIAESELAKKKLKQTSLYAGNDRTENGATTTQIERLWTVVNGSVGTGNQAMADALSATRNFLTGTQLASTALTAVLGDPFQQRNARAFAGVSTLRWFTDLPEQLLSGKSNREVVRAGVIMQDAMENLTTDLRGRGLAGGSAELSKWLPDRVFQWTGLAPWTTANRRSQAMGIMFEAGDRLGQSLAEISADGTRGQKFARWLEGFGIGEAEWQIIREAKALDHGPAGGLVTMMSIANSAPGDRRVMEVALRYGDAVHAFMEEAVPQGTATVRTMLGRGTAAGTVGGEFTRSGTMYLSYPATVMLSMIRATQHEMTEGGTSRGMAYAAASAVSLTIGGALVLQMRELANGRDPRQINDWKFWALAWAKGGGAGYYGDYVFGDYARGSSQMVSKLAGPVGNFMGDAASIIGGKDVLAVMSGDESEINRTRRLVDFGRRYTPIINHWAIKPVSERLIWDRLQLLADPRSYRQWVTKERQLSRDEGQGVWWGRGETSPRREPDFTTLWQ